ncbi:MAG: YybH family protein [Gemmatimonadaceae bacterium]
MLLQRSLIVLSFMASGACAGTPADQDDAARGIDSLNARLARAYGERDPAAYAAVFTDSGVFEWPLFRVVRGRSQLAEMARGNWSALRDMQLDLDVSSRRVFGDHAMEFGVFALSYTDDKGARSTEFGRYASAFARQADGSWLMDRFLGFADSTRAK